MRYMQFPQRLRLLSVTHRLILVLFLFVCCFVIMVLGMYFQHTMSYASLFTLLLTLVAWICKFRAVIVVYLSIVLAVVICNSYFIHSLIWPLPTTVGFACGLLSLLIIAASVSAVKRMYDGTFYKQKSESVDTSVIEKMDECLYQANKLAHQLPLELSPLTRESFDEQFTQLHWEMRKRGIGK